MCAPKSPQSNNFMRHSAVQRWLSYVYSHLIVRCARICKVCIDAMEVYGISPISVVMCILKLCAYKHFCDKLFNTHPTQWYALPSYPCYPQLYVHFSLPRDSGNGWVFTIIKTHVYIVVRLLYICDLSAAFWGIASFVYCYSIFFIIHTYMMVASPSYTIVHVACRCELCTYCNFTSMGAHVTTKSLGRVTCNNHNVFYNLLTHVTHEVHDDSPSCVC